MLIPCKKRKVYLATDGKTRLCEHGETASAISQYAAGSRVRPVDSLCTCKNVDGLTVGRFAKQPPNWPHAPSYYDVLVARNAQEVELPGGRLARKLPTCDGASAAYMLPCGNIRCAHGNSEATLRTIAKHPLLSRGVSLPAMTPRALTYIPPSLLSLPFSLPRAGTRGSSARSPRAA